MSFNPSMTNYTFWYKKVIKAKNIKESVLKEKKTKSAFHSIVEEAPENIIQGATAIGFETYDPEQD